MEYFQDSEIHDGSPCPRKAIRIHAYTEDHLQLDFIFSEADGEIQSGSGNPGVQERGSNYIHMNLRKHEAYELLYKLEKAILDMEGRE